MRLAITRRKITIEIKTLKDGEKERSPLILTKVNNKKMKIKKTAGHILNLY